MKWLISANSTIYDHASSFEHHGFIDWRQGKNKFSLGDNVYIYCTKPTQKIRYKCQIQKLDILFRDIRNDEEYWLDKREYEKSQEGVFFRLKLIEQIDSDTLSLKSLQKHGLKAAPQSPIRLSHEILTFVETAFSNVDNDDFFPETINCNIDVYEGIKKQVSVNKYERSSVARARCIEFHGCACKVCGFDFEDVYGSLGEGFIHVHHIQPLHTIGCNYKINYETDLIPVCPNCHAMLHRKHDGQEVSINKLKAQLSSAY